jgi:hypothetical protein
MSELHDTWDYLIESGIATEDECRLVTDINGFSVDSLNSIIYARTGYHDLEQLKEADDNE